MCTNFRFVSYVWVFQIVYVTEDCMLHVSNALSFTGTKHFESILSEIFGKNVSNLFAPVLVCSDYTKLYRISF
jgi:hypothetical protein